jgi:uncharacterized protein (DUF58 family)
MSRLRSPVPVTGIVLGLVVVIASLLLGRADVAVLGVTVLVAVAVATIRNRAEHAEPTVSISVRERRADDVDGGAPTARAMIDLRTTPGTEIAALRITAFGFELHRLAVAGGHRRIEVDVPLSHTGEQRVVSVQLREASADASTLASPSAEVSARILVQPRAVALRTLPLPSRLRGLTGGHESFRPGDGGEFRDIHPFATGDRLRRIDWKATARLARRPSDLFVRRTAATSDAHVAIVVDDAIDVGELVESWSLGDPTVSGVSSLDLAREAAWSLTTAYLDAGDAVSFQVLSRARGSVRRGAGARHRELLHAAIARISATPRTFAHSRTPQVASGALIYLLSTFLDDDGLRLAQLWRAAGHRVIAVDLLPRSRRDGLGREQLVALRIVLGRRRDRFHDLEAVGADVLRWDAPASDRAAAVQRLSRAARRR